ncbi:MAG: hypothetical protein WD042_14790 [Phycisphaeraceae bacterium]
MTVRALFILILTIGGATAHAAERELPTLPPETIAFCRVDPTGLESGGAWLLPMMQLLDAAGVVRLQEQPIADGLLLATLVGSRPHTIALLDIKGARHQPREIELERIQAVIAVDAPGQFVQMRQALETTLGHYGSPERREQSAIALPGQRQAVRYRHGDWPAWMSLEWTADAQRFYFGLGTGSLERWFTDARPVDDEPRLAAHRQALAAPAGQRRMIELFIDMAQMRQALPTLFRTGRTTPVLRLLGLEQASQIALHGRWADRFLVMDLTTLTGHRLDRQSLTLDHWPGDAGLPQPEAKFLLAAPLDWPKTINLIMQLVWLGHEVPDRDDYEQELKTYFQATGVELGKHLRHYRPYLLVSNYPSPWVPVPGAATVYAPLKSDADRGAAAREFVGLMKPVIKTGQNYSITDVAVTYDPASKVYYLDSPLRRVFKAPAWGWAVPKDASPVLIVSYSPPAVLANRQVLQP